MFLWRQLPFVIFKPNKSSNRSASILLLSYLNALTPVQSNSFRSVTWGPLIDKLQFSRENVLHLYIPVRRPSLNPHGNQPNLLAILTKNALIQHHIYLSQAIFRFELFIMLFVIIVAHFELP